MKTLLKVGLLTSLVFSILPLLLTRHSPKEPAEKPQEFTQKQPETYLRFRFSDYITGISEASLSAHPALVDSGENVTVSWFGVSDPSLQRPYDWVGLYCPAGADARAYIAYHFVNESSTFGKGYGSVEFTVYNSRTDCEFRYYRNNQYTDLVAISNKVSFIGGKAAPLQGHLALTGDPTQMRVGWTTGTSTVPVVLYGLSPDNLQFSASGVSRTYTASDMCGPPANDSTHFVDPGYLHDVLLTDLQPSTVYYYKYGSEGTFSNVSTFKTAAASGDPRPFKFIMYGDMGGTVSPGAVVNVSQDVRIGMYISPGAATVARLVLKEVQNGAAFVMHQGDLSYALGRSVSWDAWMTMIEPYATLAPYMVSIGNHEYDHLVGGAKDPSHAPGEGFHPEWGNYGDDSGGECGVPTFYRFHMPDTGNSLWWYSYDYGLVHFTVFSTEHNFTAGSELHRWIENDLQSVDRTKTPWVIAVGHRAMYSSEKYPSDYEVTLGIQRALEDMFYEQHVDLAVWGHYHAYERTCAVYRQLCDVKGTVHIVVGTAGFPLDDAGTYGFPWSLHFEPQYGYLRVGVANKSALHLEYVRNTDSVVADQVWLYK